MAEKDDDGEYRIPEVKVHADFNELFIGGKTLYLVTGEKDATESTEGYKSQRIVLATDEDKAKAAFNRDDSRFHGWEVDAHELLVGA